MIKNLNKTISEIAFYLSRNVKDFIKKKDKKIEKLY